MKNCFPFLLLCGSLICSCASEDLETRYGKSLEVPAFPKEHYVGMWSNFALNQNPTGIKSATLEEDKVTVEPIIE